MLKIRLFLLLQCAASLLGFYESVAMQSEVERPVGYLLAGIFLLPIPFIAGVALLVASLFRIEKRPDGSVFYDPRSFVWRLACWLDSGPNGEIRWCALNAKLMALIGVTGFAGILITAIIATTQWPSLKTMEKVGVDFVPMILVAVFVLAEGKRFPRVTRFLVGASLLFYTGAGFVLMYKRIGLRAEVVKIGETLGMIVLAIIGMIVFEAIKPKVSDLGEAFFNKTAFGLRIKHLCPMLYPLRPPEG